MSRSAAATLYRQLLKRTADTAMANARRGCAVAPDDLMFHLLTEAHRRCYSALRDCVSQGEHRLDLLRDFGSNLCSLRVSPGVVLPSNITLIERLALKVLL